MLVGSVGTLVRVPTWIVCVGFLATGQRAERIEGIPADADPSFSVVRLSILHRESSTSLHLKDAS